MGQKLKNARIDGDLALLDLRLQDAETELIIGRMDISDETPAKTGAHPFLHPLQVRR